MKKILRVIINCVIAIGGGKLAGKLLGLFDYCRGVICDNKKTFAGQIHERMDLSNIIPTIKTDGNNSSFIEETNKIKLRIIYPSGCAWNHIHSMYTAFAKDPRFQTYVLVRDRVEFTSVLDRYGCKYVTYNNYSFKEDHPDVLIATFYSSYDPEIIFDGCRDYIGTVFAEIPNVVMNEESDDIHWEYVSRAYKYLKPDYWLLDPLVYNSLKNYIDESKLVKMGSPQFDEIYEEVGRNHSWPESWNKLRGKKIFLWATDHGINESYPKNGFTIDLYLGKMLKYFNDHPEKGLIFRPHPEFVREMSRTGHFWNMDDINKLKSYMESTPNIIWDDTHDYCRAYDACDALMVDANCSITCSFLITGKPICRLLRDDVKEWLISPELHDCYYYADNFDACVSYINMVSQGDDPKYDIRREKCNQVILHFDGQNGERIKDFVLSKMNV